MSKNNLNSILIIRLTSLVIILSTLLLTLETIYHDNSELLNVFKVIDYFILTFFTIEIVFRFLKFEYSKNYNSSLYFPSIKYSNVI